MKTGRTAAALGLAGSLALASAGAGEPPVRIVPHLALNAASAGNELLVVKGPTGRFAAWLGHGPGWGPFLVCVQDLRHDRLAWLVPTWDAAALAFSHDGSELAVCGAEGGFFLDLARDRALPAPWLRGSALAFSPDDRHIWLADGQDGHHYPREKPRPYRVYCFTCRGVWTRTCPLEMNLPARVTFSEDGARVVIEGAMGYGLGNRRGGSAEPVTQTIDVASGRSETRKGKLERGWPVWRDLPLLRYPDRLPAPQEESRIRQTFSALHWHEPTRRFVVMASGWPEGGVVKAWDAIDQARLLRTVGTSNRVTPVGFGPDGSLLASSRHDYENLPAEIRGKVKRDERGRALSLLTRLDLGTGEATPLPIPAPRRGIELTPDGRFAATRTDSERDGPRRRLETWDLTSGSRLGEIVVGDGQVIRYRLGPQGRRIVAQVAKNAHCVLQLWDRDGKLLSELPGPPSDFGVSPDTRFAVFGPRPGDPDGRYLQIVELATGKVLRRIEGLRSPDGPARFMRSETVVVVDESIALWSMRGAKPLWESDSRGWTESIEPQQDGAAIVVRYPRGADILAGRTGRRLPQYHAFQHACFWHRPTPIAGGTLALDPVHGSYIARLVETASGHTIATFAPFPDPDWMVWTPDGYWTGSETALRWVSFYRGTEPLAPADIAALRQPDLVRRRIAQALARQREPRLP